MRTIIAAVIVLFCFAAPVQALRVVNADMIREAQKYGQQFYKQEADAFLLPWTVYEEKAVRISEHTERAYLYSPYLLIALHAKDSILKGIQLQLADSEKILSDYNGFLTFELMLYGTSPDITEGLEVSLVQDKRTFSRHQVVVPLAPEPVRDRSGEILYRMQCYLYFTEKGINFSRPVRLVVTAGDNHERYFNFNLAKMR